MPTAGERSCINPGGILPGGLLATNGCVLVWLHQATGHAPELAGADLETVAGVLARPATVHGSIDVARLRDWAEPHIPARSEPCNGCGATGKVECPTCGHPEYECDECVRGQRWIHPPERQGWLAGVILDRNLLAKAIAPLSGRCTVSTCQVNAAHGSKIGYAVRLDCPGAWLVLIMGMHVAREAIASPTLEEVPDAKLPTL